MEDRERLTSNDKLDVYHIPLCKYHVILRPSFLIGIQSPRFQFMPDARTSRAERSRPQLLGSLIFIMLVAIVEQHQQHHHLHNRTVKEGLTNREGGRYNIGCCGVPRVDLTTSSDHCYRSSTFLLYWRSQQQLFITPPSHLRPWPTSLSSHMPSGRSRRSLQEFNQLVTLSYFRISRAKRDKHSTPSTQCPILTKLRMALREGTWNLVSHTPSV